MKRRPTGLLLALGLCLGLAAGARADLKAYLSKPEPAYKWEKTGEDKTDAGTVYDVHLVSQTWQGMNWEHRLLVFKPAKLAHPEFCSLLNTGGNGGEKDKAMGLQVANATGCMAAILFNIPNQPLYGGKTEDALIVYTWQKFLETGDESWPLHFPMAKAVLKAMDTVQALAKSEKLPDVTGFLVYGASKRGWTTWLVGASQDPRVKAIAPMVIDTLNVAVQLPHQLAAFGGKPSEQIGDYSSGGMLQALRTPAGQKLMALEDPYSYRDILTLPKLLILGTNDRYWAQDALNLYWDGLKGPKWVSYTPNSGHGLEDKPHVLATLTAFIRKTAEEQHWPHPKWEYTPTADGQELRITSDVPIKSARLYHNAAPTLDFRDYKNWTTIPMELKDGVAVGRFPAPKDGFAAIFGEITYEQDGQPYTVSTQIKILGAPK